MDSRLKHSSTHTPTFSSDRESCKFQVSNPSIGRETEHSEIYICTSWYTPYHVLGQDHLYSVIGLDRVVLSLSLGWNMLCVLVFELEYGVCLRCVYE